MFIMPKTSDGNPFSSSSSIIRRTINGVNAKARTEADKRYDKIDKKLSTNLVEVSSEIKKLKKVIAEIREQYPNNIKVIFDGHTVVASMYGNKLQVIKAMMAATKERLELNMKETKLIHDLTGKNMRGVGGTMNERIAISSSMNAMDASNGMKAGQAICSLPSYGQEILREEQGNSTTTNGTSFNTENPPSVAKVVEQPQPQEQQAPISMGDINMQNQDPSKFTNLLGNTVNSESSAYLIGENGLSENFERTSSDVSYATAAVSINNKRNETCKVVHYDPTSKISWIRTHSKNGGIVASEGLTSLKVLGNLEVIEKGGGYEASDELGNNYDVIVDSLDNMPQVLKDEYLEIENVASERE